MRVVSWNLANRVEDGARREGEFLGALDPRPSFVMLQEVNRRSIELVCERAGLDWFRLAVDIREPEASDTRVRQTGVAVAGSGDPPASAVIIEGVPLPERTLSVVANLDGSDVNVSSYHAPPGVSWFEKKPQQAVAFARWLTELGGLVVLGADANTPEVDHPDFESVRTHWHSGDKHLKGAPGDDLLWASSKVHGLDDAFRLWLRQNPDALAEILEARPLGPLAITHRTGKRKLSPGTPRRFDSVWVSNDFSVVGVDHPYERSIQAGSDHSAVVVDLQLRS